MTTSEDASARASRDLARRPSTIVLWWIAPFVLAEASGGLGLAAGALALVWAAAMAWMGAGCLINARRCHRIHCFISGPALLAGAVVAALIGAGALNWGPHALSYTTWIVFGAALLSFAPELLWKRYG